MTQAQLETLQSENQHLKQQLQRFDPQSPKVGLLWQSTCCIGVFNLVLKRNSYFLFCSPQRGGSCLASLKESYVSSLSSLEQDNRRLRQALVEMHARHKVSSQAVTNQPHPAQDRYLLRTNRHATLWLNSETDSCFVQSSEDVRHQKGREENTSQAEVEIKKLFKQLSTMSHSSSQNQHSRPQSSASSSSSSSSLRGLKLSERNSAPSSNKSAAEGQSFSSEDSPTSTPRVRLLTRVWGSLSFILLFADNSKSCLHFSLSGVYVSVPCRRHGDSFHGGGGPAVWEADPTVRHPHPGDDWKQHEDCLKVPDRWLKGGGCTDVCTDWLVIE